MLLVTRCPACRCPGPAPCDACGAQLRAAPATSAVPAVLAYEGVGRTLLSALKYRNGRALVPRLATALAARAAEIGAGDVDVVTWAPTTPRRRRARGFDQAEVLARAVSRRLGVPARPLLRRTSSGHQTGLDRAHRLAAPEFAARGAVAGLRVLVLDDVVTTGATLRAARAALLAAGARDVHLLAAAARP